MIEKHKVDVFLSKVFFVEKSPEKLFAHEAFKPQDLLNLVDLCLAGITAVRTKERLTLPTLQLDVELDPKSTLLKFVYQDLEHFGICDPFIVITHALKVIQYILEYASSKAYQLDFTMSWYLSPSLRLVDEVLLLLTHQSLVDSAKKNNLLIRRIRLLLKSIPHEKKDEPSACCQLHDSIAYRMFLHHETTNCIFFEIAMKPSLNDISAWNLLWGRYKKIILFKLSPTCHQISRLLKNITVIYANFNDSTQWSFVTSLLATIVDYLSSSKNLEASSRVMSDVLSLTPFMPELLERFTVRKPSISALPFVLHILSYMFRAGLSDFDARENIFSTIFDNIHIFAQGESLAESLYGLLEKIPLQVLPKPDCRLPLILQIFERLPTNDLYQRLFNIAKKYAKALKTGLPPILDTFFLRKEFVRLTEILTIASPEDAQEYVEGKMLFKSLTFAEFILMAGSIPKALFQPPINEAYLDCLRPRLVSMSPFAVDVDYSGFMSLANKAYSSVYRTKLMSEEAWTNLYCQVFRSPLNISEALSWLSIPLPILTSNERYLASVQRAFYSLFEPSNLFWSNYGRIAAEQLAYVHHYSELERLQYEPNIGHFIGTLMGLSGEASSKVSISICSFTALMERWKIFGAVFEAAAFYNGAFVVGGDFDSLIAQQTGLNAEKVMEQFWSPEFIQKPKDVQFEICIKLNYVVKKITARDSTESPEPGSVVWPRPTTEEDEILIDVIFENGKSVKVAEGVLRDWRVLHYIKQASYADDDFYVKLPEGLLKTSEQLDLLAMLLEPIFYFPPKPEIELDIPAYLESIWIASYLGNEKKAEQVAEYLLKQLRKIKEQMSHARKLVDKVLVWKVVEHVILNSQESAGIYKNVLTMATILLSQDAYLGLHDLEFIGFLERLTLPQRRFLHAILLGQLNRQ